MTWTPDRIAQLKKLHADGLSFAQIARKIGGISRNAAIGKALRLGLPVRDKARDRQFSGGRPPRAPRIVAAPIPIKAPDPIGDLNTIDDRGCRYIADDIRKPGWRCCGHETAEGTSWCAYHLAIVAVKPPKKERAA